MFTDQFIIQSKSAWSQSSSEFPSFREKFSSHQKKEKEEYFSQYLDNFKKLQQKRKENPGKADPNVFFDALRKFMMNIYGYGDESLNIILHPDYIQSSKQFLKESRHFDPQLKKDDIYQAMRNVWIMNGLQLLLGIRAELTPSVFAYSLLYPYTDNLLDDPSVPDEEKKTFNERLESRLTGQSSMGTSDTEQKISSLVSGIESQYLRDHYLNLYQSLQAIHRAQIKSLDLMRKGTSLTRDEILTISIDKGGSSVLADGFLVAGELDISIQQFFFDFGVWLQLADDLQDMDEDTLAGTKTLFSYDKDPGYLSDLTNKTFHFGRKIMEGIRFCPAEINIRFKEVILKSIELLMIQYIGLNHTFFQREYCEEIEKYSSLSFNFLREIKKKGTPGKFRMIMQMVDAESL